MTGSRGSTRLNYSRQTAVFWAVLRPNGEEVEFVSLPPPVPRLPSPSSLLSVTFNIVAIVTLFLKPCGVRVWTLQLDFWTPNAAPLLPRCVTINKSLTFSSLSVLNGEQGNHSTRLDVSIEQYLASGNSYVSISHYFMKCSQLRNPIIYCLNWEAFEQCHVEPYGSLRQKENSVMLIFLLFKMLVFC